MRGPKLAPRQREPELAPAPELSQVRPERRQPDPERLVHVSLGGEVVAPAAAFGDGAQSRLRARSRGISGISFKSSGFPRVLGRHPSRSERTMATKWPTVATSAAALRTARSM